MSTKHVSVIEPSWQTTLIVGLYFLNHIHKSEELVLSRTTTHLLHLQVSVWVCLIISCFSSDLFIPSDKSQGPTCNFGPLPLQFYIIINISFKKMILKKKKKFQKTYIFLLINKFNKIWASLKFICILNKRFNLMILINRHYYDYVCNILIEGLNMGDFMEK